MIRPALVGGGVLVLMEVLNEYGAVHYFGVNTLTVGIFRSWFSLGDLTAAMKLSAFLLIGVLMLVLSERKFRDRIGYSLPMSKPFTSMKINRRKSVFIILLCSIPVLFGFIFPLMQLISWVIQSEQSLFNVHFLNLMKK